MKLLITAPFLHKSAVGPKDNCIIISIVCHIKWYIVYGYVHTAQLSGGRSTNGLELP